MHIEQVDPSTLIPYELNNRTHDQKQVDRIANSIASFGFNQPIVVDEQNIVLAGHGRLAAALKLGLRQVPIVRATELTEAQKKAYRILDNKLQNDSTWEYNNLALELDFLKEADIDIAGWGLEALDITAAEFKPNLSPSYSLKEVTDEDLEKRAAELKDRYSKEKERYPVTCPDCGAEFEISK